MNFKQYAWLDVQVIEVGYLHRELHFITHTEIKKFCSITCVATGPFSCSPPCDTTVDWCFLTKPVENFKESLFKSMICILDQSHKLLNLYDNFALSNQVPRMVTCFLRRIVTLYNPRLAKRNLFSEISKHMFIIIAQKYTKCLYPINGWGRFLHTSAFFYKKNRANATQ